MGEKRSIRNQIYWLTGALLFFLLLFLSSQIFLHPSSVGNAQFLEKLDLWAAVFAINFLIVLALSFFLLRNLIKLFFEYRHERIGSKIKVKLVTVLIVLSLLPSVSLFLIAFALINSTLTQWFNAPELQMLSHSEAIADNYYRTLSSKNMLILKRLRDQLQREPEKALTLLRETLAAGEFQYLYWKEGKDSLAAGSFGNSMNRDVWNQSLASRQPALKRYSEGTTEGFITVLPVHDGVLAGFSVVPVSVMFHIAEIRKAETIWHQTGGRLREVKANYFILLGLTTLVVMFGFAWFGFYTAKKITVPIEALAEGSRQVATGDLAYRIDCPATDELEVLINSFNEMTAQLEANRRQIERSSEFLRIANAELETRKNFIETILQNIGTAVLSLDDGFMIQTANVAAGKIFNRDERHLPGKTLTDLISGDEQRQVESLLRRARLFGTHRRELIFSHHLSPIHVAVTATSHLDPTTGRISYLVVLDDLTEFIRAEKFAAWQEVARRLAHEIKNPLTPIQLTAERLLKKFRKMQEQSGIAREKASAEFADIVEDSTRTIQHESQVLKEMVDEFSRFARLPLSKPIQLNIHRLIDETLHLYDSRFNDLYVDKNYSSEMPDTIADPEQMKRVFVNLIDNALEAMDELGERKRLEIRTRVQTDREAIRIEVTDNGPGIAAEDYERLFLPYFSTKKRGTGLGLAIVRQIISEHHGNIRAEANVPRGSRFIIELPVAAAREQQLKLSV
ncbi:MAG TPA: ATP-binding protein [Acidobacteriota bacterium]|jgi:PAS domain S-box-containing protein|nr:ATP-binding protein [Acidobacteriota bacterium]